tara:strand:+ start:2196 stop:3317 length:1122 start_codon:yes stop_codon:yes gene_type:complete
MFEWDRQGALALLGEYKAFWGPSKNTEFGITGKPDANTRKVNAKSVYLSVENHGRVGMSRKNIDFSGGGAILEKLLSFLERETFLEEDLLDFEDMERDLDRLETRPNRNPANITFRTMTSFKPPATDDDEPEIKRGVVAGHFLTVPYWEYRQWKANKLNEAFPSDRPKEEWYAFSKDGGEPPKNKAKPPLWQALLGEKNSLRKLVKDIKELVEKSMGPGGAPIKIDVNANLGPRTGERLAAIAGLNKAIREVMADGTIYTKGRRFPVKSRLNDAVRNKTFNISSSDLTILVETCTVKIDGERVEIDEVVNYEKINNITMRFPKSNKTLNNVVRAVMGEQMETFKVPGSTEGDGITLKQLDAMEAFSNLMKVIK